MKNKIAALFVGVCLLPTSALAAAGCEETVASSRAYFSHGFTQTTNGTRSYLLEQIGDSRFPIRFGLRECTEDEVVAVSGWGPSASSTVSSIFWSNTLGSLLVSSHEFGDEVKGQGWYTPQSPKLIQFKDGTPTVVAEKEAGFYLDAVHHPVTFISSHEYVTVDGVVKQVVGLPLYGITDELPEKNWYYTIGWDEAYGYANIVQIEELNNELRATKSIHIAERPSWFEKVLVWLFDLNLPYRSEQYSTVLFYDRQGGSTSKSLGVWFDESSQKVSFYQNGEKVSVDVLQY